MDELKILVSDEEVVKAFKNTNFGSQTPRDVIKSSLLKIACGYRTGHTAECILVELKLTKRLSRGRSVSLTDQGKMYLYEAYSKPK